MTAGVQVSTALRYTALVGKITLFELSLVPSLSVYFMEGNK